MHTDQPASEVVILLSVTTRRGRDVGALKDQLEQADPLAFPILQWCIASNRCHLTKLAKEAQIISGVFLAGPLTQTPHHHRMCWSTPPNTYNTPYIRRFGPSRIYAVSTPYVYSALASM